MVPSEYVKKSRAAIEGNNYAVKVTINRDKGSEDYGKVIGIEFGMNKKTGQPYTTEEARQLLLVSCARKNQGLAKTDKESFLDLILTHPEYYTSEGCSVRLPQFKDEATQKDIENTIKSCTEKSLKDASDIMIPIAIKTPEKVNHMCVIVATQKIVK